MILPVMTILVCAAAAFAGVPDVVTLAVLHDEPWDTRTALRAILGAAGVVGLLAMLVWVGWRVWG